VSQVAVIGLGRFGFHVAKALHQTGHEVLAVDIDETLVQRVRDCSTQAVVLDARETERLRRLGVSDLDVVVVSLGERIDASSLVALHLKEMGVKRLIVKAASEDHARLLELIGVTEIVFPELDAAERLAKRLADSNLLDFIPLGETHSILELNAPDEFLNRSLADLRLRNRFGVQVLAVRESLRDRITVNPGPETVVESGDVLFVLGANQALDRLRKL
jgi:trk system potassium uptake protein TrkA